MLVLRYSYIIKIWLIGAIVWLHSITTHVSIGQFDMQFSVVETHWTMHRFSIVVCRVRKTGS